jgi:hypothetical protein
MLILSLVLSNALAADFECDPIVSPIYPDLGEFAFAVSGTLLPRRGQPTYIEVLHEDDGEVLAVRERPTLYNDYSGGYWLDTYGLNTWRAGRWGTTVFYFLLEPGPVGDSFPAYLHLVAASGGSYVQLMDCQVTS